MKIIFETERLVIRELNSTDSKGFYELHSNRNVMNMIPAKILDASESENQLKKWISDYAKPQPKINVWAMIDKKDNEFIGLCATINEFDAACEIGYRLREVYWNKGIGTEITKGLIEYVFTNSDKKIITADVTKTNLVSRKILEKFMMPVKKTFNKEDNCIDIHYELSKENWLRFI